MKIELDEVAYMEMKNDIEKLSDKVRILQHRLDIANMNRKELEETIVALARKYVRIQDVDLEGYV